jgi:hypothetical protein
LTIRNFAEELHAFANSAPFYPGEAAKPKNRADAPEMQPAQRGIACGARKERSVALELSEARP